MSWGWKKPERKPDSVNDPQIQNARRIVQDGRTANERRSRDEHTDHPPRAIDSDFCYEEDNTPCA